MQQVLIAEDLAEEEQSRRTVKKPSQDILTPEHDEQVSSETHDTQTPVQGGEDDPFPGEIKQKNSSDTNNMINFGDKAKVNLLHETGDDHIPDMEGGGLDVRLCGNGRHTVALEGDKDPCMQHNADVEQDADKEIDGVDAVEEPDADEGLDVVEEPDADHETEPPDDGADDKAASGESYDQYSHTPRRNKLGKSLKTTADMLRQFSLIMVSWGLVMLLVSMMLGMTAPMTMGHKVLVASHTGGLYNILRFDAPFFDGGDWLPPGGGDDSVAQYPEQKRRNQLKRSLNGGYSDTQSGGGYRDLQRGNSYITDPETGGGIRFAILFLVGGEASDWDTVHDGEDLDPAHKIADVLDATGDKTPYVDELFETPDVRISCFERPDARKDFETPEKKEMIQDIAKYGNEEQLLQHPQIQDDQAHAAGRDHVHGARAEVAHPTRLGELQGPQGEGVRRGDQVVGKVRDGAPKGWDDEDPGGGGEVHDHQAGTAPNDVSTDDDNEEVLNCRSKAVFDDGPDDKPTDEGGEEVEVDEAADYISRGTSWDKSVPTTDEGDVDACKMVGGEDDATLERNKEVHELACAGPDEPADKGGGEVKVDDAMDHISRDTGRANSVHTTDERDDDAVGANNQKGGDLIKMVHLGLEGGEGIAKCPRCRVFHLGSAMQLPLATRP